MDSEAQFDVPEMHCFKGSRLEALRMSFCLGAALIVRTSSLQIFVSGSHIWLAYPAMGFMGASNNEAIMRSC